MKLKHNILSLTILALCIFVLQGCRWIDDDLSVCGTDAQITYQVKLVTTLDLELNTVLSVDSDQHLKAAFTKYFDKIFVDYVHDVDLSFYSKETQERVYHENHIIDASEKSFVLYLKSDRYTHLSACNIDEAVNVELEGDEDPLMIRLMQAKGDTLMPHTTGLFTARLDMDVQTDTSQNFLVPLYMANSGIGLVVDTLGSSVKDIEVYVQDMATDFWIMDSVYHFLSNPLISMEQVPVIGHMGMQAEADTLHPSFLEHRLCYATTCFPSRDTLVTSDYVWRMKVYVHTVEDKIAENTLTIKTPLRASSLRILKIKLGRNGEARVMNEDVGASVNLDWHGGNVFNPDL